MNTTADMVCPSCERGTMQVFYEVESVPINSCIQLGSAEEARNYPRGDIRLGFCSHCGFISNLAFDSALIEYSTRYESTQKFSHTFSDFHKTMAQRLIDKYGLLEKHIVEIGCGNGEFLVMLCELGNNRGTGIDPAFLEDRIDNSVADRIEFIREFYSEQIDLQQSDFVCCKMTLEHIHTPAEFMKKIKNSVKNRRDIVIYFQIPNTTRIIESCAFEDIYYEHCSYFSPGSLAKLFRHCGFEVISLALEFGDQYLTIEARPSPVPVAIEGAKPHSIAAQLPEESDLETLAQGVYQFPAKFAEKKNYWEVKLDQYKAEGKKVVLWGSGSKGVSFLTTLTVPPGMFEYIVDINPYRQGYFMVGTGNKIVSPDFLQTYQPDVVIIMNGMYRDEIAKTLHNMTINPVLEAL